MNIPKIDKDVPITGRTKSNSKFLFLDSMEIGDSFEVKSSERGGWMQKAMSFKDKEFISRIQINNNVRIWRTK